MNDHENDYHAAQLEEIIELQQKAMHTSTVITLLKEEIGNHSTKITQLKRALKFERKVVDSMAIENNNGHNIVGLLCDIKDLVAKHGGFQNAFAINYLISIITKARQCQNIREKV